MDTSDVNATNITEAPPPAVRYFSSVTEEAFTYAYIVFSFLFVVGGNSAFVTTIARNVKFHTPQYAILVSFSAVDCTLIFCSFVIFITMGVLKDATPVTFCSWFTTLGIGAFFGGPYQIGVVAWERYMFFCRPMYYHRFVNKYTVGCILGLGVWGLSYLYVIVTQVTMGRTPHSTVLSCHLGYQIINGPVQFGLCFVPSLVMTIFATVKIYQLMTGLRVAPAPAPGEVKAKSSQQGMTPLAAIRMILLVAGAFWGTYIPLYIMRILVFGAGYTWQDLDTRRYIGMSIALRYNNLFLVSISTGLNPLIYFFTHKDVRQEFKRMVGCNVTREDATSATGTGASAVTAPPATLEI